MIINDLYNNKKQDVEEGRFVKGPGGVPLDRQGRPVAPKAEPMRMRQWIVHHEGQRGEGGEMIIDAPNFETAWELANEYDLDIIDIKPAKGVSEGAELKKQKRAYNQAAKDANADQVGAGKKIDTMKKSLRQKDLDKPVAEGMPHGQDINDPLDPNYGGNRNRPVKRNIQARLGHDQRGDARVHAGQPRSTHARHKPQLPESAMDDNAIWSRYGHYNAQDLMQEFPNLSPKDAQTIVNYAEYGWSSSNPQKFRNEVVSRVKTAMGLAEGNPVPGQNFATSQGAQMNWNPASKSWQQQAPVAPNDPHTNISTSSAMNTKDVNGTPTTSYSNTTVAKNPATGSTQTMTSTDHGSFLNGVDEDQLDEVSLGDYRKKAMMSKAMAQTDRFFGRDNPAKVTAANRTIANRERGLAGADARRKPYTPPPVDQEKQRRDLADKYPNIDELVAQAEKNRDPYYDRAEGNAYYAGRDAEHNYHRLKQIQRMIRGAELDEMDFGDVSQTTDSDTGDITTSFNQGPISVSQTKTPGGYTKQTDKRFDLGPATMTQKTVGPNIGAGQLAGTTTKTATNNMTGQSQQQVKGVGFGGASGANVGKNYVGSSDDELAQHAASVFNTNESVDCIRHLAGIKPVR